MTVDSADMGGMASSLWSSCRAFSGLLGHAGGFDFLLQFVEFALFAAAEFLLDGLDFLVEVVLFLGPLHLPLDAGLDAAVHVEFFDLDFQDVGDLVRRSAGSKISSSSCFS